MEKRTTFLLLFLFSVLLSLGQNIKHISLDFNADKFKVHKDIAGNVVVFSESLDCFFKSDTLLPALPYIGYNVLIGSTEKYDSYDSHSLNKLLQSDVTMARSPQSIPTNMRPSTNGANTCVSYSSRTYPAEPVEFVGINECDGHRILSFHVCPFEYDAISRKLYLRTHIDLDIHLKQTSPFSQTRIGNRNEVRNIIRQMVVNPEDLDELYPFTSENRLNNSLAKQNSFEYVIVTSNQFKNTFQELANWKSRKGIRSKVLTVEDISLTYTGSTTKEKIKRALADVDNLSYVLLGGDTLNVPTCMCYIGHHASADSITPADVYYSCLETMNWDSNGNGFYGELSDSVSLIPSLIVSRAPVSTIEDAQVFVNRIISYESAPDTTNWEDNILMSGTSLGFGSGIHWQPYYLNGQSDSQLWSQMIYEQYIAPSWIGQRTRFYDTYTDISEDGSYEFNTYNLQEQLARGFTFVDVMTHGTKVGWEMEDHNAYYYYIANGLVNSGYSIITSTACLTNAFDYYVPLTTPRHCLSQHFMNNPQSGILAYWGTSRENWHTFSLIEFPPLSGGDLFDALTYSKLFADKNHRMGKAAVAVKIEKMTEALSSGNYYSSERKIWMGLNLMGDPEMPVYLSRPETFQNVSIQFVNDSIYVDAGTGGFDICFINQSDSTDYYIARNIADSVAVFGRINGVFDVCITKPGYIPYITTCDNFYLQNKTLSGTKIYQSGNAIIGLDVTNIIAHGPVVINNGSTTVKASQEATITKDFEVELGAEFTITNE